MRCSLFLERQISLQRVMLGAYPQQNFLTNELSTLKNTDLANPSNELIVLVHGFFKNKKDMAFLEKGLFNKGYSVTSVDLPTTFGSIETCHESMIRQLNGLLSNYSKVHFE